jgi:hypothetical protein
VTSARATDPSWPRARCESLRVWAPERQAAYVFGSNGGVALGGDRRSTVSRFCSERITHPDMTTMSLKLPDRLIGLLEAESRARGTTKSSLVRECIEKSLALPSKAGKATCFDLARDLAGSVKGLPRRLATNPKYMEGFGGWSLS